MVVYDWEVVFLTKNHARATNQNDKINIKQTTNNQPKAIMKAQERDSKE